MGRTHWQLINAAFLFGIILLVTIAISLYEIERRNGSRATEFTKRLEAIERIGAVAEAQLKNAQEQNIDLQIRLKDAKVRLKEAKEQNANLQKEVDGFKIVSQFFGAAYEREEVLLRPYEGSLSSDAMMSVNDTSDRHQVDCQQSIYHKNVAILFIIGQSNASNTVSGTFDPSPSVINFDPFNGQCYDARDPLLGPTNFGSNFATRLASKLVDRGAYQVVIIANIAFASTSIQQWALGGELNRRIVLAIKRLHDAGLEPTHVLWHQGEANIYDSGDVYSNLFMSIFSTIRRHGVYAPIYVAQATVCYGRPPAEQIRPAQRGLVHPAKRILAGPDTDTLGSEFRYDDCHFNARGADRHAELWYGILDRR